MADTSHSVPTLGFGSRDRWLLPVISAILVFGLANSTLAQQSAETSGAGAVRQQLAGKTFMTFSEGHGTQVSYLQPDGTEFLWYPGNKIVLAAKWRIEKNDGGKVAICFQYSTNSYNPVTDKRGGAWECRPVRAFLAVKIDSAKGDVLGLADAQRAPYILARERTTIAELKKRLSKRQD